MTSATNSAKRIGSKVAERILIALLAIMLGTLIFSAVSAHAATGSASATTPVVESTVEVMGPVVPVSNVIELPKIANANCFNIYRDDILLAECIKPRVDTVTGNYYFDDSSPEVVPSSRFTYSVSAVNDTGESPRLHQTNEK
jgi:hypothetical protein